VGFGVGASAGLALHLLFPATPGWLSWVLDGAVEPLGRLFLKLLLLPVLPIVASSLVLGVSGMGGASRLGRIALKTLAWSLLATSISVAIGLGTAELLRPGEGFPAEARERLMSRGHLPSAPEPGRAGPAFPARLLAFLPDNPVRAAASGDLLGVMALSLLFGLGVLMAEREKVDPLLRGLEGIYEACMAFISLVLKAAPYGVGALALNLTARFGWGLLGTLSGDAFAVLLALALHQFGTYSALVAVFARTTPWGFFRSVKEVMLTAFATSSSSATLPVALRVCESRLGVRRDVGRFVLTVGASANQNGTALYEGVTALFLAQCFGVELTLAQKGTVMALAILGGIGTAGVPGGSLPMLMAILSSIGVPAEAVLLILGVDRFLDMARTVLNVTGDLLIALLVDRSEAGPARHASGREAAPLPALR